ncbi:MAG: YdhR family protein [Pyrinomonadaceae bacterium]|nr:YdhR family protein [Pyrinomonadaceae bacterium]
MITVLVQFPLPAAMTQDEVKVIFAKAVPSFYNVLGLVRKYFLLSEESRVARGVYLWKTRKDAERFYQNGFRQSIVERFGSEPSFTYFESPVIINNLVDEVSNCEAF